MTLRTLVRLSLVATLLLGALPLDAHAKKSGGDDHSAFSAVSSSQATLSGGSSSNDSADQDTLKELDNLMDDAQVLFDDAETEDAALLLTRAEDLLPLQRVVVPTATLLRLYRQQAVVWIAAGDDNRANRAIARAVAAAPNDEPPASYGAELRNRHTEHVAAMVARVAKVKTKGDGRAWLDGGLVPDDGLTVVIGDHLVQVERSDGISSDMRYISRSFKLTTESSGEPVSDPVSDPGDAYADLDEPAKKTKPPKHEKAPKPDKEPKQKKEKSSDGGGIKVGWLAAGGLTTAAGGGLLALSYINEQTFQNSDYSGDFGGSSPGDEDWESDREDQILQDGQLIRATYFAGYGLVAVGLAATTMSFLATPTWDGQHVGVALTGHW